MTSRRTAITLTMLALVCGVVSGSSPGQQVSGSLPSSPWADWIEPDFPFFSSVLDAGRAGPEFPARNLTPRGMILNLGRGLWVGVRHRSAARRGDVARERRDADERWRPARIASPTARRQADSFLRRSRTAQCGSPTASTRDGRPARVRRSTIRASRRQRIEEVGRGPLPDEMGRFTAVRLVRGGVVLEYIVRGANVREWMTVAEGHGAPAIVRNFKSIRANEPLWLMLGTKAKNGRIDVALPRHAGAGVSLESIAGHEWRRHTGAGVGGEDRAASEASAVLRRDVSDRGECREDRRVPGHADRGLRLAAGRRKSRPRPRSRPRRTRTSWTTSRCRSTIRGAATCASVTSSSFETAQASASRSTATCGWSAACTNLPVQCSWKRFASGLHEPMTLAIRDEQVYVFDRNGIWRLLDTNGDGEADVHELFSNAFAQTADMREFPSTLRLAPGGEFVIAKGGQEATTIGKHNGSVLRISADGRTRHGARLRLPAAAGRRQRAHRPRHGERSAGPLRSVDATAHRARPAVLRIPERQAAARGLSRADCRPAHVDSALRSTPRRCRRCGCSARAWARSTTGSSTSASTNPSSSA